MEQTTPKTEGSGPKYVYCILPPELEEKLTKSEDVSNEERKKYEVSEEEIKKRFSKDNCYMDHTETGKCACRDLTGRITYKDQRIEVWMRLEGTQHVVCYRRYQTCVSVCS